MLELLSANAYNMSGSMACAVMASVIGLLTGSFLNVVIHRLPQMMQREADNYLAHESGRSLPHIDRYDLWAPRSACPHCAAALACVDKIPVLSYLLLHGRCRYCRKTIPLRYPVVESFSALLAGWLGWRFGLGVTGLAALAFAFVLITLSFIDAQTGLLPDSLTLPLLWLGLLVNLGNIFSPLRDAVIGAVAGYLVLWMIYWIFRLATGKEGLGYGDFKLLAALGAWLGWQALPIILLLSSCLAAAVGIAMVIMRKTAVNQPLSFGPYLAAAGMLALLYGESFLYSGLYR
jgi:leader peptidase (prepilin peptidase)/N-methyltransferase